MRHKILLPTDFSDNAWHAIDYATELYKNEPTDFYILNVFSATENIVESLMNPQSGNDIYESKKWHSEDGLAKILDKLVLTKKNNPKHHFKTISAFNNTIDAIKDIVDKKDIDMIVMGTKGQTHSSATAFGSTAIYVMEKVRHCPVIVVPLKAQIQLPKEIVFPTGFEVPFKKRELVYLKDIAKKSKASIIVLHVKEADELDDNQKDNKALLEEILEDTNFKRHTLSHHSVIAAINVFVESRESDMVAFINKKHKFFGSILTSPLVKEISFHLNVPILAMHDLRN
ncbi:universal stress protein [Winogradskyella aquimaris]|uniref:Universal stress protein n=1 Tax=Winogradskyella aquimaris TaxID=864074 RepID=A0ABU5ENW2_9FLAO|nr:universal stress protein [Winogradskyella aquimaris]MDY2587933.1 universal stress protein [Winogradskyella aquimaris]